MKLVWVFFVSCVLFSTINIGNCNRSGLQRKLVDGALVIGACRIKSRLSNNNWGLFRKGIIKSNVREVQEFSRCLLTGLGLMTVRGILRRPPPLARLPFTSGWGGNRVYAYNQCITDLGTPNSPDSAARFLGCYLAGRIIPALIIGKGHLF